MGFIKNFFLTSRFFYAMGCIIALMMLSYGFPMLLPIAKTVGVVFFVVCLVDTMLLFNKGIRVEAERDVSPVLSLGDKNTVRISLLSRAGITLHVDLIDELPEQFQIRNFRISMSLKNNVPQENTYQLRPVSRGEYSFGKIHLMTTTGLALIRRRITFPVDQDVAVYPSIIQMKRYELKMFNREATQYGLKKVRRIGHSYEFDSIKQYVRGDDYRSINWKVTSRKAQLMVNQYDDEKSQQVYCIIDKGRTMHMPFHGLSLFDYAVNASLVISNIALAKQDKAGLITFAEKPKTMIRAERSKVQLKHILEALYKERETSVEANYESIYTTVKKFISGRSLLFLYTNFESSYALQRVLPHLRKLNNLHLLVVVFFENTEIMTRTSEKIEVLEDIYTQVTAEQYALSKIQIAQQLRQAGIVTVLTTPENLTVASINKYLELKSRGMI
jgi:uncharacterized protein (DUF58 family)